MPNNLLYFFYKEEYIKISTRDTATCYAILIYYMNILVLIMLVIVILIIRLRSLIFLLEDHHGIIKQWKGMKTAEAVVMS